MRKGTAEDRDNGRNGASDTFGESLLACHASLYRYARSLAHDPSIAEELVQEAYRKALSSRKHPQPPTEESLRPWLFTIVRNYWYNDIRRRRTADAYEIEVNLTAASPVMESPDLILTRRLMQSEVRDAVGALPELLREVIVLREIESMSYQEIADLQQCPIGTVMSRLSRARATLRAALAPSLNPCAQVKAAGASSAGAPADAVRAEGRESHPLAAEPRRKVFSAGKNQ